MEITIKLITSQTTSNETFYGGEVYLKNKLIKIIPLVESEKAVKKYLALLSKHLVYENRNGYDFITYVGSKGQKMDYFNNVPIHG